MAGSSVRDSFSELLHVLDDHGQQFMQLFPSPDSNRIAEKQDSEHRPNLDEVSFTGSDLYEEWFGINPVLREFAAGSDHLSGHDDSDVSSLGALMKIPTVVFSDKDVTSGRSHAKAAFMSSKIVKVKHDYDTSIPDKHEAEVEEEANNAQNDALLHRLVHTKLLSASLNPDLDMKPGQRRKAVMGRVLEISGEVKLGKGEKTVRDKERNKAAKHIRLGLMKKEKDRLKQGLEEAKNLGNYHSSLKHLFSPTLHDSPSSRQRDRGLRMGVGKFRGGILRLSKQELESVRDSPSSVAPGKRKRRGAKQNR